MNDKVTRDAVPGDMALDGGGNWIMIVSTVALGNDHFKLTYLSSTGGIQKAIWTGDLHLVHKEHLRRTRGT